MGDQVTGRVDQAIRSFLVDQLTNPGGADRLLNQVSMFDPIHNRVKQHAGPAVVTNPAIPIEQNETVLQTVTGGLLGR